MYWDEGSHAAPHFHAHHAGTRASVDFVGRLVAGDLDSTALRYVQEWAMAAPGRIAGELGTRSSSRADSPNRAAGLRFESNELPTRSRWVRRCWRLQTSASFRRRDCRRCRLFINGVEGSLRAPRLGFLGLRRCRHTDRSSAVRRSWSARLGTTKDARKIGRKLFPVHRKATVWLSAASKV